MSVQNKSESDFSCEVVKVLKSERVDAKNRMDLRIVQWSRSPSPVLEKRRIWEKDGVDRPSKMSGLTLDDVKWIYQNYPEIINLM